MAGPNPFAKTLPLTSLGAVGGARGTAAGALRIIVDFVANYDGERVKQLTSDLNKLAEIETRHKAQLNGYLQQQEKLEKQVNEAQNARKALTRAQGRELARLQQDYKRILDYEEKRTKMTKDQQAAFKAPTGRKAALDADIKALAQELGLSQKQVRSMVQQLQVAEQLEVINKRIAIAQRNQADLVDLTTGRLEEQTAISQFREQAVPRLLGLGVGAVGGIFGGALFGVGFAAAQDIIDRTSDKLQDMVDPAKKARDAAKDLASALDSVGDDETLTNLEKAQKLLQSFGPSGAAIEAQNPQAARVLALASATAKLQEQLDLLNKTQDQLNQGEQAYTQLVGQVTNATLKNSQEAANLNAVLHTLDRDTTDRLGLGGVNNAADLFSIPDDVLQKAVGYGNVTQQIVDDYIRAKQVLFAANDLAAQLSDNTDNAAQAAADYADELERATNAALDQRFDMNMQHISDQFQAQADAIRAGAETAINTVQNMADHQVDAVSARTDARIASLREKLSNVSNGPSRRTQNIQNRIDNLGDGESARTRALQAAIDRLNASQERRAYLTQLAGIAEERYELKLQHSLETTNKYIKIADYSGKARVIAIEASITRLEKQGQAQDRLNQLLDLQYEASKKITREEGETIQEFLDRRAQEYRHQIADRQALDRQEKIDRLQGLKDEAEYRVSLAENTQQRLQAIREREQKLHEDHLQKLLAASRDADQRAQAAQRDNLQKQLDASRKADQANVDRRRKAIQAEIDDQEKVRDAVIKAIRAGAQAKQAQIEKDRDKQLKANELAQKAAEDAEKAREEIIKRFADRSETDRFVSATKGARSLSELNAIAGKLAGGGAAYNQLNAYITGLGLNDPETKALVAGLQAQYFSYKAAFSRLTNRYADGGVFDIRNSMNFGSNMQAGEQGQELGIILSNRVVQALESRRGAPVIGTVNMQITEDPVQARYKLQRKVREAQEASL